MNTLQPCFIGLSLCCSSLLRINDVMKSDQKQAFISFSLGLCCFVTHGVNVGNSPDQREDDTVPVSATARTTFSRSTPDPTVHHVPVIWILVLADRVEKRDKERKEEEAI